MTQDQVRQAMIKAAVKNLKEFGYPDADADNIFTDRIYREFFRSMLTSEENKTSNKIIEKVRVSLLEELEKGEAK